MAFSDTMKVVQKDLNGFFYNGKQLRKSDVLSIDPKIPRIVFRAPLDIKAINCASTTELILAAKSKILHIMCAGRLVTMDNLFCGSLEAGQDIIIKGNLTSWIGDVETVNGNICVSGSLSAEGRVIAPNGYVIVNNLLEAYDTPQCLKHWSGAEGRPLPETLKPVAGMSGRIIKGLMTKLGGG